MEISQTGDYFLIDGESESMGDQTDEDSVKDEPVYEQLDLFSGDLLYSGQEPAQHTTQQEKERLEKEKHLQEAMLRVKSKYGKNAILKAADLQEGATTIDRNRQIGGHKA